MNTLKRIVIILGVALAVVGVTVALAGRSSAAGLTFTGEGDRPQLSNIGDSAPGPRAFQHDEGDRPGGGQGLGDLLKNFLIFGLIGAVVVGLTWVWDGLLKPWFRPQAAPAPVERR